MSNMFNPPHPASIVRDDVLPELGLTVTQAAEQLGVSRVQLSRVLNERAAISADLALRLGQWVGNGADVWMRMQADHDLWKARQAGIPKVKRAKPIKDPAERAIAKGYPQP